MFKKYATVEDSILEVKTSSIRIDPDDKNPEVGLSKFAALDDKVNESDGYLYVRARAISSRVNKNNDGWPSQELANAYRSFLHRPSFVDHNNDDPSRARGVVVSTKLHVEEDEKTSALDPYYATAPDNHKPHTWVEILHEVDAKTYPKLAEAIRTGKITATSMGANIDKSVCSVCQNEATTPSQYCSHIKQKGMTFEITADNGEKIKKKAYEDCYGVNFFEDSFVFDPADETAVIMDKQGSQKEAVGVNVDELMEPAGTNKPEGERNYTPQSDKITAPTEVDTLRNDMRCPVCNSGIMDPDPDGIVRCPTCGHVQEPDGLDDPDLSKAVDADMVAENQDTGQGGQEVKIDDVNQVHQPTPSKPSIAAGVISEMWTTKLETNSKAKVDAILPKQSAVAETTIEFRGGIHFGTHMAFKNAGITATVTYPDGEQNVIPGAVMKDFMLTQKAVQELGLSGPQDVPITVDSENLDEAVNIIHEGGMGAGPGGGPEPRPVGKAAKKNKNTTPGKPRSDEPQNEKVISDQLKPVTSNLNIVVGDDGVLRVADTRQIKRHEQSPDGTVRTEEIIEQLTGGEPESTEEPQAESAPEDQVTIQEQPQEEAEPAYASTKEALGTEPPSVPSGGTQQGSLCPQCGGVLDQNGNCAQCGYSGSTTPLPTPQSSETKLLTVLALAELAEDLGVIDHNEKLVWVAEVEKESPEQIEARRKMLDAVKEAGLGKTARKVQGIKRVPRLSHSYVAPTPGNNGLDELPIEAIFNN